MVDRIRIGLWQLNLRARKCVEALRKNGFDAHFLPDEEAVRDRVLAECEPAASIGFGGRCPSRGWGSSRPCRAAGRSCSTTDGFPRRRGRPRASPSSPATCSSPDERGDAGRVPCEPRHEREPDERDDLRPEEDRGGGRGPEDRCRPSGGAPQDQDGVGPAEREAPQAVHPVRRHRLLRGLHLSQRICRVYSIIERRPPHSDITVLVCGEPLGL